MRIVNPKLEEDLREGRLIQLNLGCGARPKEGYYGVDCVPLPDADIVGDLNETLRQLPDNSVSAVFAQHILEHIVDFLPLLQDLHRVMVPNGRIDIVGPHYTNPYAFSDPTHVRFFGLYTFFYFADEADQPRRKVPSHYLTERLLVESVSITLMPTVFLWKPFRRLANKIFNRSIGSLDRYERSWARLFPADSILYSLRVKKPVTA